MKSPTKRILAGLATSAALVAGLALEAQADPPPQRPLSAKTLFQAKDAQRVFPYAQSIKAKASTRATKNHMSACTGNDNLKDLLPVDTTWYGTMTQVAGNDITLKITQQAADDGYEDGDATDAFETVTGVLNDCAGERIDGLTYQPATKVKTGDFTKAAYYTRTGGGVPFAATIVVTNQDHVNVLEVEPEGELTNAQLTKLTKLAATRAR